MKKNIIGGLMYRILETKEHPHLCGCPNGWKMLQDYALLPFTVMGLYVNLLAVNHSEVASDKKLFTGSILALFAKALYYAFIGKNIDYNHSFKLKFERDERLFKTTSPVITKNRA